MNEKVCRLCLQTITTDNCQPIGLCLQDILKLSLNLSDAAVKCMECTNNLEVFLKFKSACDYMTKETLSTDLKEDIAVNAKNIDITNNLLSPIGSKGETRCCFCTKFIERENLTSINETKEHTFLVGVLKEYIPELNLNITAELLTCETCLEGLQSILSFLLKCLDVEQNITKYIEMKGTEDKGQIELKNVQQFMFNPTVKLEVESKDINDVLRVKYDPLDEKHAMETAAEIKCETEMDIPELIVKTEAIYFKSELNNCESAQEPFISSSITRIDDGPLDILEDPSQKIPKKCDKQQDVTYKNMRETSSYETKRTEITMFKCEVCAYETKRMGNLKQHELIHKNSSEITMFKCELCSFETKRKIYLKKHKLVHKSSSEVPMFKCEMCVFETKHKTHLKRHEITHKSTSEVTMFKCEMCAFETKYKEYLKQHKLTHKSTLEVTMFKCEMCPFETKHKVVLKGHVLIHKSPSEITMYKCELCSFETKRKNYLTKHKLIHKSTSEVKMFKCEMCAFETKRNVVLKRHNLVHKSPSEIRMFKCELCPYKTKRRYYLKEHRKIHKHPSEVTMYKCELCSFETKHKIYINRHKLIHDSHNCE